MAKSVLEAIKQGIWDYEPEDVGRATLPGHAGDAGNRRKARSAGRPHSRRAAAVASRRPQGLRRRSVTSALAQSGRETRTNLA